MRAGPPRVSSPAAAPLGVEPVHRAAARLLALTP